MDNRINRRKYCIYKAIYSKWEIQKHSPNFPCWTKREMQSERILCSFVEASIHCHQNKYSVNRPSECLCHPMHHFPNTKLMSKSWEHRKKICYFAIIIYFENILISFKEIPRILNGSRVFIIQKLNPRTDGIIKAWFKNQKGSSIISEILMTNADQFPLHSSSNYGLRIDDWWECHSKNSLLMIYNSLYLVKLFSFGLNNQ